MQPWEVGELVSCGDAEEGFGLLRREDTSLRTQWASGAFCLRGPVFSRKRGQRARVALYSGLGEAGRDQSSDFTVQEMGPNWIVHLARVTQRRPRSSCSCSLSSFIWSTLMRGLLCLQLHSPGKFCPAQLC